MKHAQVNEMEIVDGKVFSFELNGKTVHVGLIKNRHNGIKWPDAYRFIADFNFENNTKVKMISFDAACNLPFGTDMYTNYIFPVDAIVAYEKPGIVFGNEIIQDPHSTLIAFSTEQKKEIKIEYNKDAPKIILPTWRYHGKKDVALLVFGLDKKEIQKKGNDVFLDVSQDRFILVPIKDSIPKYGEYIPEDRSVVYRNKKSYVGPIIVHISNYDDSYYFGTPEQNVTVTDFDILVEISDKDLEKLKK